VVARAIVALLVPVAAVVVVLVVALPLVKTIARMVAMNNVSFFVMMPAQLQ